MVARALLDELTFGAVSRRERPVGSHVPYTRHVDDHIITTRDGLVLTIFKLDGYSFETSDISAGGFFVTTDRPLPVGASLHVRGHLPDLEMQIQGEGRVVRAVIARPG